MSSGEKEELQKAFNAIDENGDGQLSKKELYDGYMKVYNDELKCNELVETVFSMVDTNNSGKVDYTGKNITKLLEFVVAASKAEKLLNRQKLEQTFKIFDTVLLIFL